MPEPVIKVENIKKTFDGNQVLKGINLEVHQGEILALMGSSGGGKTTLLKCISGLIRPTEGRVVVSGLDVRKEPELARKRMGMVFQSAALFDYLNVHDNVAFGVRRWKKVKGKELTELVDQTLLRVGLDVVEQLMPSELSGGMRKRVGIARARALQPDVILYDEPTTGLDPITTYTIDRLIVSLREEVGVTSIVVSHDVNAVLRVADRIAFLHKGELAFLGTPDQFESDNHASIRELVLKAQAKTFFEED